MPTTPTNLSQYYQGRGAALPGTAQQRFADPAFASAAQRAGYDVNSYHVNMNNEAANNAILRELLSGGTPPPANTPPSLPRVPAGPTPPTPPTGTPPVPAGGFTPPAGPTPPPTQEQNYATLLGQSKSLIDAITKNYQDEIKSANAASAARSNAGGLAGSSAGGQIYTEAQQPIIDKRNLELEKIYAGIRDTSINLTQADKENYRADKAAAEKTASSSIAAMAANHLDWNAYKTTNPDNYKALVNTLGGDPNVADAMFAMSVPANIIDNSFTTSDGAGGTVVTQVSHDPVTNKPNIQKFTIPGISVPQNWTSEKFGTNALIYKSPTFDPNDSKTWFTISTDPTNSGAITVTKDGVTTVNGVPINQTPGVNPTGAVVGASGNVASIIGLPDPTLPLASVIDDPSIGLEGVIAGMIKNEGGSPKGVLNNPGNIKFVGSPGQKDSGVKATDGGTFASYATPQDGKTAIGNLINRGAASGKTFEEFVNSYTGTGSGSTTSGSGSILSSAGISLPVFNYLTQGTSSMTRMNASQRKAIQTAAEQFLNSKGIDVSTFQSQYKAYNDVLQSNISRNAKTKIMESELSGTVDNLLSTVSEKDLGDINIQNVADVWAGKQTNDPVATRYAFHFEQLKNELAGYFAASQGKASPDVIDNQDAANAVINGMSTGSLTGFKKAVEDSTSKMGGVLQRSVDDAQKNVWSLFGVGDKYKSKTAPQDTPTDFSDIQSSITLNEGDKTAHIPRSVWSTLGSRMDDLLAEAKADGYKLLVD